MQIVRLTMLALLLAVVAGCINTGGQTPATVSENTKPIPKRELPEDLIEAEPVSGINIPMPAEKYESKGVGDELEKLILTDFKKDFTLYKIYEFPTESTKPEVLYVFTRKDNGGSISDPSSGVTITKSPMIYSYKGLADKMSGGRKAVEDTHFIGKITIPNQEVYGYVGAISADYTLKWIWYVVQKKDRNSEIMFLLRSKGPFKNELLSQAIERWWTDSVLAKNNSSD
ncbi:MAG: hypothetical protein KF824_00425 [Fimbriimonadaceae bacterium]|nr:MAG: hypothetical protein KF824_00425 [Fimbriimonadaceae bacterium]